VVDQVLVSATSSPVVGNAGIGEGERGGRIRLVLPHQAVVPAAVEVVADAVCDRVRRLRTELAVGEAFHRLAQSVHAGAEER
jgi:hypothetical protein